MKLSMWMIANRLSALDPELHIKDQAPIILRSARRAYATNCVQVFQVGKDVICNGEGNYLRLKEMSASQAFEIIQCVFDFYDDWNTDIVEAVNRMDYQQVIDESWHIFHNPVLLLDANYKALAMSAQYGEDDISSEWKHLSEYGYLSAAGFCCMREASLSREAGKAGGVMMIRGEGNQLGMNWMSVPLSDEGSLLGWLNVLEADRKFNTGDVQLLLHLRSLLAPSLSRLNKRNPRFSSRNIFSEVMQRKWVSPGSLEQQLDYMGWGRDDPYRVYLLVPKKKEQGMNMALLRNLIAGYLPQAYVMRAEEQVIIIANETQLTENQVQEAAMDVLAQKETRMGASLRAAGIAGLYAACGQARAALKFGRRARQAEYYYRFYDYAIDFIIESSDPDETVKACQPDVARLLEERKEKGGRMEILKSYLENERSLVNTANALFIHRNTLVYRLKKILEELEGNLDEDYTRDYMKLSIRVLELYGKEPGTRAPVSEGEPYSV